MTTLRLALTLKWVNEILLYYFISISVPFIATTKLTGLFNQKTVDYKLTDFILKKYI